MTMNLNQANASWGESVPDWVVVLAQECDESNQKKVSALLDYSPAVVNTVLKNTYNGDLRAVEQAVRGALLGANVDCPVLGDVPAHHCLTNQRLPFASTNSQRVRLYKACRVCQHNRTGR